MKMFQIVFSFNVGILILRVSRYNNSDESNGVVEICS